MKKLKNKDYNALFKYLFFLPGFRSKNKALAALALIYYLLPLLCLALGLPSLALALFALPFIISYGYGGFIKKIKKDQVISGLACLVFAGSLVLAPSHSLSSLTTALKNPGLALDQVKTLLGEDETFQRSLITRVVDGDTIEVDLMGQKEKVRLILVDTPETVHPNKGVEFYGKEASAFTKNHLEGRLVYLEKDTSETDRYGRLLRYVWLEKPSGLIPSEKEMETSCFNLILIKEGYGQVVSYPPDIKYENIFLDYQEEARKNERGLWQDPQS